jgi:hypothetical protein
MRLFFCLFLAGCAPATISLLEADAPVTVPPPTVPLEVVTRSNVPLFTRVENSGARFCGLEQSLGRAVTAAVTPWAAKHADVRPEGWQLLVDLNSARASAGWGHVDVRVDVRVTLRERKTHEYISQAQAHCAIDGAAAPNDAAPVFHACLAGIGRDLASWLGSITP